MKKSVLLLLIYSIAFLCSCYAQGPADNMELIGDGGYQTSNKASDEDTSLYIDPGLKADLESGRRVEFPLYFQITSPGELFIESLNQALETKRNYLMDREDFFEIDDYLLYVHSDALAFPSRLRLETPARTIDLLTVTQPIKSMSFYSSHELCIALVNAYEGNGEIEYISYYLLDLQNGTLSPLMGSELVLQYGLQYLMYDNILIKEDYPSLDRNYAVDIYHVMQSEESLLLSGIQLPCYANGLIYYKRDNILYSSDFDGSERELFSFQFEVEHMQVFENMLICVSPEYEIYALDLTNDSVDSLSTDVGMRIASADERGVYLINHDDKTLSILGYDGETIQVATDFQCDGAIYTGENWIYYWTDEYSQEVDYYISQYWKVGIGEANMGEVYPI